MIAEVDFSIAIAIYLVLILLVFLVLWIFSERRAKSSSVASSKDFFWQCDVCTYIYVDSKHRIVSQCPRCKSYNKREEGDYA